MDFRETDSFQLGTDRYEIVEPSFFTSESTNNGNFDNKIALAKENEYLIDVCLETKRTDILSEEDLRKHGIVALYTAIDDLFLCMDNAKSDILKRIDSFMNRAIAENLWLNQISKKAVTKSELQTEFLTIHKRFS